MLIDAWKAGKELRNAPQLFVSASYTYSQQLAEQEYAKREVKPVEEMVPPEYHEHLKVFSERKRLLDACQRRGLTIMPSS